MTSKKSLEIELSKVPKFPNPKIELEQYVTPPELASAILWDAYLSDHIYGKTVADFGCGTGMFCRGAELLGAEECVCLEIDESPLGVAKALLEASEPVQADVLANPLARIDTVVMNPPFGTQKRGTDKAFLVEALRLAKEAVYSIHISSGETVKLFRDLANSYGFEVEVLPVRYRMRREYWWHKKKVHEMPVDVYRFVRVE